MRKVSSNRTRLTNVIDNDTYLQREHPMTSPTSLSWSPEKKVHTLITTVSPWLILVLYLESPKAPSQTQFRVARGGGAWDVRLLYDATRHDAQSRTGLDLSGFTIYWNGPGESEHLKRGIRGNMFLIQDTTDLVYIGQRKRVELVRWCSLLSARGRAERIDIIAR
jgi:hypothetical protein